MAEAAALVCLVLGTFFFAAGTVGILRMPDVYTRMHVAAKSDTLGAGLWLIGLAIASGGGITALKLVLLLVFLWVTSPTAAHCMARAAHRTGVPTVAGTDSLEDPRLTASLGRGSAGSGSGSAGEGSGSTAKGGNSPGEGGRSGEEAGPGANDL